MKRTFKVNIVFMFTLLLLVTGSIIISYTYQKNKESMLTFVKFNFERSALSLIEKTSTYMSASQILTEISVKVLEDPNVQFGLDNELSDFLLEVVKLQPQTELFYFGDEQGNFQQAAMLNNEVYSKFIDRRGSDAKTSFQYFDMELSLLRTEEPVFTDETYDPRVRPWYKGAKYGQKTFWTEPYVFFETGKPGITVASPVFNKDLSLKGVVASDITLAGLSKFLKDISLSEHSLAFIYSNNGQLVAYPDPEAMVIVENGEMRNVRPQELNIERVTEAIRQYKDGDNKTFSYRADGESHLAYFSKFPDSFSKDWTIALIAPENDFIGIMKHTLQLTLLLSCLVLAFAIFLAVLLARSLSKPIEQLKEEVIGVLDFNLEEIGEINSPIIEIQELDAVIRSMKRGLKSFRKYVPATLVQQLIASGEDARVGGQERELSLFFSDIEGFTRISENMPPQDLMIQLSEYFDTISSIITEEHGTVDKFIGDAVMAFWGAPIINENNALDACRAALRCQAAVEVLNKRWTSEGRPMFKTRIGVNTGYAIVGNIGSERRMNYTVLGDAVNLASRLEGVNKFYGTETLVSQGTFRYVQNKFICRMLDTVAIKGKAQFEIIYELMGVVNDDNEQLYQFCKLFNQAYCLYTERQWTQALTIWQQLAEDKPEDKYTLKYIRSCQHLINQDPGQNWSPITNLKEN